MDTIITSQNYSRAHLLFLAQYDEGRRDGDIPSPKDDWYYALGETPEKAIDRFLQDGMMEYLDLSRKLNYRFRVIELKDFLKQKGLKLSGKKAELIQRIIEEDRVLAESLVSDFRLLGLTQTGQYLSIKYRGFCKYELEETQTKIIDALQMNNYELASELAADHKARQVRFSGLYVKPNIASYLADRKRYAQSLRELYNFIPRNYIHLHDSEIDLLRLQAAFQVLSIDAPPKIFPADFTPDIAIKDPIWASRAFIYGLSNQKTLDECKKLREEYLRDWELFRDDPEMRQLLSESKSYEYLYVCTANDDGVCLECKKLAQKKIRLENFPELPYEKCTSKIGCRCSISPINPSSG